MIKTNPMLLLLLGFLPALLVYGQEELPAADFHAGIMEGRFDAVLDVRRQEEWDAGHIMNATFLPNLQEQTTVPEELMGCENACKTIVVYCRSGSRSLAAIQFLQEQGFEGTLLNGMGVQQWTDAGFDLVNTSSVFPSGCATNTSVTGEDCSSGTESNSSGTEDSGMEDSSATGAGGMLSFAAAIVLGSVLAILP